MTQERTIVRALSLAVLAMWAPKPALTEPLPGSPFMFSNQSIELHMYEHPVGGLVNGNPSFATATINLGTPDVIGPFALDCSPMNGIPTCIFREDMGAVTAGSVVVGGC